MPEELVSTKELCEVLDIKPRTIARWKADGCPCVPAEVVKETAPDGASLWNPNAPPRDAVDELKGDMWNVAAVVAWTRQNGKGTLATNAGKKPKTSSSSALEDELLKEKIRKERAIASDWERLQRVKEGKLIERDKVEEQRIRQYTAIRNALLSIPGSVAAGLVGLDEPAIRQRLQDAVDHVLSGLAGLGPKPTPALFPPAKE